MNAEAQRKYRERKKNEREELVAALEDAYEKLEEAYRRVSELENELVSHHLRCHVVCKGTCARVSPKGEFSEFLEFPFNSQKIPGRR